MPTGLLITNLVTFNKLNPDDQFGYLRPIQLLVIQAIHN